MHNIEVMKMEKMTDIEKLLKETKEFSKKYNITTQETLLLKISYDTACIHDHIEKVIFGTFQAHAQKEKKEK